MWQEGDAGTNGDRKDREKQSAEKTLYLFHYNIVSRAHVDVAGKV